MLVHRWVLPSIKFAGTHLYTLDALVREASEVSFPRTCNTMSLARSRLQTSISVGERTSHNATAPPTSSRQTFTFRITILIHSNQNVFYVCGLKLC